MWEFHKIAERRIDEAMARGEFDNLEGRGRPLPLDDDALVPPEMRLAWRILRNAGYVPEEIGLRGEIAEAEALVAGTEAGPERGRAVRRLSLLYAKLDARRGAARMPRAAGEYHAKLLERLITKGRNT